MKKDTYRNGKIPGRRGYGIDDVELVRLFDSGLEILGIADKMGISQWTVLAHLKKLGLRRTQRHTIARPDAFAVATDEACYWAGFLAADGFVVSGRNGIGVELSAIDVKHLKELCRFVGRDEKLFFRQRQGQTRVLEFVEVDLLSSKLMDDLVNNFNIVPRKSLILEPPDLPRELRRHFIRGYFDGDGSIGWHKHNETIRLNFCSGSERFLEWIWNTMCEELGDLGQRTIGSRKNSKVRTLELSGDAAIKVLEWMYGDGGDTLCLKRKHDKFLEYKVRLTAKRATRADKRQTTIDEMVNLYTRGLSYSEIAEKLNTTKEKVSYYLAKIDVPKRTRKTDSVAGTTLKQRDQEILTAYLAGEKVDNIAKRFGLAKSSCWVAIRRTKETQFGC
jgi:DNA-binding CsgD family transcriptional regulator